MTILPLTYLGNIQYYTKLLCEDCVIDLGENFIKQSYRSRCEIVVPQGVTALAIPVVHTPNDKKCRMLDVRIDNSKRWQHNHLRAITSAYRSAPYFDHLIGHFEPFYTQRHELLAPLTAALAYTVLRLLRSERVLYYSERYVDPASVAPTRDFRATLSPKPRLHRPDTRFVPVPYYQLFGSGSPAGFRANLSVIDLLMCEGPSRAAEIISASYR